MVGQAWRAVARRGPTHGGRRRRNRADGQRLWLRAMLAGGTGHRRQREKGPDVEVERTRVGAGCRTSVSPEVLTLGATTVLGLRSGRDRRGDGARARAGGSKGCGRLCCTLNKVVKMLDVIPM